MECPNCKKDTLETKTTTKSEIDRSLAEGFETLLDNLGDLTNSFRPRKNVDYRVYDCRACGYHREEKI